MMSIVVPAHNERWVIGRLLTSLLQDMRPGEFEIVVVCNGCTDDTAEVARRAGGGVRVIEIPTASKIFALNAGDCAVKSFPRFYIDADVVVGADVLRAICRRLSVGDVLVCSPMGCLKTCGSSWAVRQYFRAREHLPSAREGIGGSGVYAVSERGRKRFGVFPNVVADDSFVRFQFSPHERATLHSVSSTVFAPLDVRSLFSIRTRIYFGLLELSSALPAGFDHKSSINARSLCLFAFRPALWPGSLIYLCVNLAARARAHLRFRNKSSSSGSDLSWLRDETTRKSLR